MPFFCNVCLGGTSDAQASRQDKSSSSHSHIFGNEDSDDALSSAPTLKQRDPEASSSLTKYSVAILKSSIQPTAPAAAADPATSLAPPQFRTSRFAFLLPFMPVFGIYPTSFLGEFGPALEAIAPLVVSSGPRILPPNSSPLESERLHI
jgi:hypothetical protein